MARIKLTSFVKRDDVSGSPGEVIDVTSKNRDVCEWLVRQQGAYRLADPDGDPVSASDADDDLEEDSADSAELTRESPVGELATLGVHPRYVKALTDAGLTTLGAVADIAATLQDVSGISPAAADQIRVVMPELPN